MPKRSCQNLLYISPAIYRNVRREQTYDVDIPAPRIRSSHHHTHMSRTTPTHLLCVCASYDVPTYLLDHKHSEGFICDYLLSNLSQTHAEPRVRQPCHWENLTPN